MKPLITHSRQACFKECRRKHEYMYGLGMRLIHDARALRMGSAFHEGIAALGRGMSTDAACNFVDAAYEEIPERFDAYEWLVEREIVLRFVCAYHWRWQEMKLENVAVEGSFRIPLLNPATGYATPNFDLGGKIDGIVRLEDGRLAVKESKFLGEDISSDSPLWRRLRVDQQISLYIHAARVAGYPVDTVLYDVVRKPAIKPEAVAITDADGVKIVLDASGERVRNVNKTWRQTSDTAKGYVLQTRAMTMEEWGDKLTDDICDRPDFYFARVEIPRLDQDVAEYQSEVWDVQKEIRGAQLSERHFRTVSRNCQFCPFFELCCANYKINPGERPPEGFEFLSDPHPELEGDAFYVHPECAPAGEPSASTAATETFAGV